MRRFLITSFFVLILFVMIFSGCLEYSQDSKDNVGEDFTFTTIEGEQKKLSDYRGKNVLIDFFGVNCQPCAYQMYVLAQIHEEYKNKELIIISIDAWIAYGETIDLIKQYISSARDAGLYLNWTFGVDDSSGTLLNKYASSGVPMLYLYDKNGKIYYSKSAYTEYSILAEKIDELLK
jgi:thiol-disulfide isomerase/thioredoxin